MNRKSLKERYQGVKSELASEFGIKNKLAVPKIAKIVINMGIGKYSKSKEDQEKFMADLGAIAGQKPVVKAAKVSIATFNIRRGMPVGLSVTLRGSRMYNFLDKLVSIVLPRLRDFRGVSSKSFDKDGNYTIGLAEHTVFPEIDLAKTAPQGLEITIVITASSKEKSKRLLELLGMTFEKLDYEH